MLNQFRRINIVWDGVNKRINERINLVVGGGGRTLAVTVISGGQAFDTPGVQLALNWKASNGLYSGSDAFDPVGKEAGTYELVPPDNMVRSAGTVRAALELSAEGEEPITSMPFEIYVKEAI